MQQTEQNKPLLLNLDTAFENLKPNESPFIRDMGYDVNGNPNTGTQNPTGEGQNFIVLTPLRSNKQIPTTLPAGNNMTVGSYYSETTQELYYLNKNSNNNHGIYVISGATYQWQTVIIDPNLNFSDDPAAFIANHRVALRTVLDKNSNVVEKFLMWTDGNKWQGWISVNAAIQTNGFDASKYPYWTLQQPHYDRRELIEWPTRPPMYRPVATPIPNTTADATKINQVIDKAFQFCIVFQNTDGRKTAASPYSLPVTIKSEDYLSNPDNLPKNIQLVLPAGSPLTELMYVLVRINQKDSNSIPTIAEWSDWYGYDTLYRFTDCGQNNENILGTSYWLRQSSWGEYNYDPIFNTITYNFDNSKSLQIVDQQEIYRLQNDIPQISRALADVGNSILLSNNRLDYDNFSCDIIDAMSVNVLEKPSNSCNTPLRNVYLYCYIGRPAENFIYNSQIGYHVGVDTQYYFGSLGINPSGNLLATFDESESKYFDLTFADRKAPICYLKGTPFYSDGLLYQVDSDNSFTLVTTDMDFSDNDVLSYVNNVFLTGGYFMYRFQFEVPAGRYIAAMGRHNVESTGDYRNTSTYVEGIANSRIKSQEFIGGAAVYAYTIKPNALVKFSKEMEIDCVNADVDVWGNGSDLFYIYCPYNKVAGNGAYRFIEGYFQESSTEPIGVELFPYHLTSHATDDSGTFTDKNGFYFAFTKVQNSDIANIEFVCKLNCTYPTTFIIPTGKIGIGWCPNAPAYLSDHNNGVVGACNRILYSGKITDTTGTIGYSNISVSIVDGATTTTDQDGNFTLIIHNGQSTLRTSNVYVNSGGNYLITLVNCGYIPLNVFNESEVPCFNCDPRVYPTQLIMQIVILDLSQTSLKQGVSYDVGSWVGDLAGRLTYVNIIANPFVPSFLTRQDTLATYFQLIINGVINFISENPDAAWFIPLVSKNLNEAFYIEWVGDSIQYIDGTGNVVSDPASAVYVSIAIDSLYNYNVTRNFSLLASYQFTQGDRIKFYDDGNGNLLTGNPIDLQILGTNYNQAAINANLIPNNSTVPVVNIDNTVNNQTTINNSGGQPTNTVTAATVQNQNSITLYVLFDPRLSQLLTDTGFWIELYTPAKQSEIVVFKEGGPSFPIINGQIAIFTGVINGKPQYSYPQTINLDYWDTYLFQRTITIPNVGSKYINHPFESPNVSDNWGANITSGGRIGVKNDNARQTWYVDHTIKSDDYINQAVLNGLGTFRTENSKIFKDFKSGGITATKAFRNLVAFICENDYFITDYNFQYIFANAQGVSVANLDDNLGSPHQKVGDNFGCAYKNTKTIIFFDKYITWYDFQNSAWVLCNWQGAEDITETAKYFVKSYFYAKTNFIEGWNADNDTQNIFDVSAGIDPIRNNLYVTFRPRRNETNNINAFINNRRNVQLDYQETIVYNMDAKRWVRFTGFCQEEYNVLKGQSSGLEMISFAAGNPYLHNNSGNQSFANYNGVQCTPNFISVFNKDAEIVKVLQNISQDSNPHRMFIDLIYSEETNSYSFLPINYFRKVENQYYSGTLRNMVSYPPIDPSQIFRSMLLDGKRNFGRYFVVRFVMDKNKPGEYMEMKNLFYVFTQSGNIKK
jgi:hypothetical protein